VTVTVVIQVTLTGVLVIVKLLTALLVFWLIVKKAGSLDPSFFAFTSIVTPWGGMVDVIVTVNGKSVCGAAGWFELAGGFSVTTSVASLLPPPPPPPDPLSQSPAMPKTRARVIKAKNRNFLMTIN
jgi:uncharacterized SAM-binding protein YcdF (DUF218 family)